MYSIIQFSMKNYSRDNVCKFCIYIHGSSNIREVCQVLERYVSCWSGVMVMRECKGMLEGVITFRRFDSP